MDNNLPESTIVSPQLTQPVPVTPSGNNKFFIIGGIILVLILIGGGVYFFVRMRSQSQPSPTTPTPTPIPTVNGAKFFLSADPMEASVGGQIKVSVFVKSDKDAANLFIAKLKFPNQILEAKNINLKSEATASGFIKDWFISNWVENTIDNDVGSVSLVGGVPNPGFQTQPESSGSAMADIIFTAKSPGDSIISFDDTSAVYRNSDNTNVLFNKESITVKISGPAPTTNITPMITEAPQASPSATAAPSPAVSPTPSGPVEGDVNQDNIVDFQDLSSLLTLWGKTGTGIINADLNKDEIINSFDYSRLTKLLKDAGFVQ